MFKEDATATVVWASAMEVQNGSNTVNFWFIAFLKWNLCVKEGMGLVAFNLFLIHPRGTYVSSFFLLYCGSTP